MFQADSNGNVCLFGKSSSATEVFSAVAELVCSAAMEEKFRSNGIDEKLRSSLTDDKIQSNSAEEKPRSTQIFFASLFFVSSTVVSGFWLSDLFYLHFSRVLLL